MRVLKALGITLLVIAIIAVVFAIAVCITSLVKDMSFLDVLKSWWEAIKGIFVKPDVVEDTAETLACVIRG